MEFPTIIPCPPFASAIREYKPQHNHKTAIINPNCHWNVLSSFCSFTPQRCWLPLSLLLIVLLPLVDWRVFGIPQRSDCAKKKLGFIIVTPDILPLLPPPPTTLTDAVSTHIPLFYSPTGSVRIVLYTHNTYVANSCMASRFGIPSIAHP